MGITKTTINNSALQVTLQEKCKLGNVDKSTKSISSYGNITDLYNRIVSVATGGTELAQFTGGAKGAGLFGSVNYIRITNKDSINFITVTVSNDITAGDADAIFAIKILAGRSIILPGVNMGAAESDANNMITAGTTIGSIHAVADTAVVDTEIVIGG